MATTEDFCIAHNCEHYVEWEYTFDSDCEPARCYSCKLIGQSHYIEKPPENCPHTGQYNIHEQVKEMDE